MTSTFLTRRDFSTRLASFFSMLGIASAPFGSGPRLRMPQSARSDELSHTAGAIHQEVVFNASRKRVYEALSWKADYWEPLTKCLVSLASQ